MERTEAVVQTAISLYQVLSALETFSYEYPCERLAPVDIERIETYARVLKQRLMDYKVGAMVAPIREAAAKQKVWV